jgi:hypothetical protein
LVIALYWSWGPRIICSCCLRSTLLVKLSSMFLNLAYLDKHVYSTLYAAWLMHVYQGNSMAFLVAKG